MGDWLWVLVCGLNFFDFIVMGHCWGFFLREIEKNFERVLALPLLGSLNLYKKICFYLGDVFFSRYDIGERLEQGKG